MPTEIVYHGLGYVGLTGAVHFAKAGCQVIGFDLDQGVVDAINAGTPKAGEFLSYLGTTAAEDVRANLSATADFAAIASKPIHIVAVPSEKEGQPYMDIVYGVLDKLFAELPEGGLIIVESTLQPTALDVYLAARPALLTQIRRDERFLAHAPRRDWFADPTKNVGTIQRVVGGVTPESTRRAVEVLSQVTPEGLIMPTDYRTAELVKPLENALFHVPIMLGHELALAYPDHNIAEALRLATTHWRFHSFGGLYLGLGAGGRCVPLGSAYLQAPITYDISILSAASKVDAAMPRRVANVALHQYVTRYPAKDKVTVLILGVAYRPEFRDAGLSPGLRTAQAFLDRARTSNTADRHIDVRVHDAVFTPEELTPMLPAGAQVGTLEDLAVADIIVLATPHGAYLELPEWLGWIPSNQVIVDARGTWRKWQPEFEQARCLYLQVGAAGWRS